MRFASLVSGLSEIVDCVAGLVGEKWVGRGGERGGFKAWSSVLKVGSVWEAGRDEAVPSLGLSIVFSYHSQALAQLQLNLDYR